MGFDRYCLVIASGMLFCIGLMMIFNTSSAEVLDLSLERSTHQALIRQMLYALLGSLFAMGLWTLGYRSVVRLGPPLLVFWSGMLLLTHVPGVGVTANGSSRWIGVAGMTLQPSEFVKYVVPLYCVSQIIKTPNLSYRAFLKIVGAVLIPMVLILLQPNNGTVAVVGSTVIIVCLLGCVPFKYWGIPMLVVMAVAVIAAVNMPYVSRRLEVYMNPELDIRGRGHQPRQAKIAAGSGKLFGKGPGKSFQKLSYLPEAQNDYIAAIYAEEYGFVGMTLLITLYTLITYVGFRVAFLAPDWEGYFAAAVCTFLIGFQAFLNLGVVSGLLPSTGLNLPLFSQGGTSLIANIMGLGLILNVAKQVENHGNEAHRGRRWWHRGTSLSRSGTR